MGDARVHMVYGHRSKAIIGNDDSIVDIVRTANLERTGGARSAKIVVVD